jgi:hypothetical protein
VAQLVHVGQWAEAARRAVEQGATKVSAATLVHNLARACEAPVYREYVGAVPLDGRITDQKRRGRKGRYNIEYWVRCRKCAPCRRARARYWAALMQTELAAAVRSWMWTLTLHPDYRHLLVSRSMLRLEHGGTVWEHLSEDQQFAELVADLYREVQRAFKRLRKAGHLVRYVAIAEPHKDGFPHLHVLVHEHGKPFAEDEKGHATALEREWKCGFSYTKLICERDPGTRRPKGPPVGRNHPCSDTLGKVSRYVAKYLAKTLGCRIRASQGYGKPERLSKYVLNNIVGKRGPT